MAKNKGLGMGLEALLKMNVSSEDLPFDSNKSSEQGKKVLAGFVELEIDKIVANPEQPRKNFDQESLNELAQSIKNFGLIQPITVVRKNDIYEIVTGERRFRASKIAGLSKIPVIIKDISQKEKLELSLVENIQRENLNPIEEALAYSSLIESYNVTQEELASRIGKSRTTITNSIRLLNLDVQIRRWIMEGKISPGHGRAILSIEDAKHQLSLAQYILDNNLSVREVEALSKKWPMKKNSIKKLQKTIKSFELSEAEKSIEQKLKTKVSIVGSVKKGKIEINYFSEEELERIIDFILENK